jgi:hypothetical protein
MNEKIREWFERLDPDTQNAIEEKIEEIRHQEDEAEKRANTVRRMIKELARTLEDLVDDPTKISTIIKHLANGRISDDAIERTLPDSDKTKTRPKKVIKNQIRSADLQQVVTIGTDGSTHQPEPDPDPEPAPQSEGLEAEAEYYKDQQQQQQQIEPVAAAPPTQTQVFKLPRALAHHISFSRAISWAEVNGEAYILLKPNKHGELTLVG